MAARVYSTPEGLDAPDFGAFIGSESGGFDSEGYFAAVESHRESVAAWCRENTGSRNPLVGECIRFGVADGRAEYMVYTTSPLALIHLPYVDAYEADPILLRGLRVSDVKQMVKSDKAIAEIFGRRS